MSLPVFGLDRATYFHDALRVKEVSKFPPAPLEHLLSVMRKIGPGKLLFLPPGSWDTNVGNEPRSKMATPSLFKIS